MTLIKLIFLDSDLKNFFESKKALVIFFNLHKVLFFPKFRTN
jgi:hypothetical protein